GVWRGVEQRKLASIRRLENGCPLVQVDAADRVPVPRWLRVPGLDPPPELIGRHVEVVQFDSDTETTSHGSHLVTFDPRPEPEIEDHAQPESQDFLGEAPELVVELFPGRLVPGCGAEGPEPFVLREAHGAAVSS